MTAAAALRIVVPMSLHLIKLCVGCPSVEDLRARQSQRLGDMRRRGEAARLAHVTRMMPRRADELLDGGSLYWVIKGHVLARQALIGIEPFRDSDGVGRCRLVLGEDVVEVRPRPLRAFQGWRYLVAADAPPDLAGRAPGDAMPDEMRRELAELGLL